MIIIRLAFPHFGLNLPTIFDRVIGCVESILRDRGRLAARVKPQNTRTYRIRDINVYRKVVG